MNSLRSSNLPIVTGARAAVVNRTHRVVRDEALTMRAQRSKSRSLWVPLTIFSVLLLDGYDITPNGIPDASDQMMLLLLWSLPVTTLVLGMVWLRRGRSRSTNSEVPQ
jgi:hypothetical protein